MIRPAAQLCLLLTLFSLLIGCKGTVVQTSSQPKKTTKVIRKTVRTPDKDSQKKPQITEDLDVIDKAFQATRSTTQYTGKPEELVVRKVTTEITRSLDLGPTLVVWLIDRTNTSFKLASSATTAAKDFYESQPVRQMTLENKQLLLTAVVGFDEKIDFVLDPPSDNWQAARDALGKVPQSTVARKNTFAAVKQVLEKYGPLRTSERQVVLVILTSEAGDDSDLADEVVSIVRKQAIPVYVVGTASPWGQGNPYDYDPDATRPSKGEKSPAGDSLKAEIRPVFGPESVFSERVNLPLPVAGFGFRGKPTEDLIESGFGPQALERLCREGGGAFLPVRPVTAEVYGYGVSKAWPTGSELRFDPAVVEKYAPDYIGKQEYLRSLAENKAKAALHEAAKIGHAQILDNPDVQFPKAENEAQLKRLLDAAQQASARVAPAIDKLYEALIPGEGDRDKLTSPRWQAEYDYALGRVLAAKVRVDTYNQMIASLKGGKGPKDVKEYNLEPADSFETSSALKKMADKARLYLQRVIDEHPGTPWAKLAADDLKVPLGWKWQGS